LLLVLGVGLRVVAGFGLRTPRAVDSRQQLNSPLSPLEQLLALGEQPDPAFVASQGVVEADLALFQVVNDLLQGSDRRLEAQGRTLGVGRRRHRFLARWIGQVLTQAINRNRSSSRNANWHALTGAFRTWRVVDLLDAAEHTPPRETGPQAIPHLKRSCLAHQMPVVGALRQAIPPC
jgi:hypothetical protein